MCLPGPPTACATTPEGSRARHAARRQIRKCLWGRRIFRRKSLKRADHLAQGGPGQGERSATPGVGSPSHVWGIHFQNSTEHALSSLCPIAAQHRRCNDLLSGQIDLACLQASDLLPQVRSGNIKAYAILADAPWARAPEIPTVDVAGVPGLHMPFWHGFWAPANTPKDIIDTPQYRGDRSSEQSVDAARDPEMACRQRACRIVRRNTRVARALTLRLTF